MEDRAYLGGMLDFDTEDERLFSAHEIARERGMIMAYRLNDFEVNYQADTYGLLVWSRLKDTDKEIYDIIRNCLGESFVAIKEVKDTRGKTGIFAEADRIYGWKNKNIGLNDR